MEMMPTIAAKSHEAHTSCDVALVARRARIETRVGKRMRNEGGNSLFKAVSLKPGQKREACKFPFVKMTWPSEKANTVAPLPSFLSASPRRPARNVPIKTTITEKRVARRGGGMSPSFPLLAQRTRGGVKRDDLVSQRSECRMGTSA